MPTADEYRAAGLSDPDAPSAHDRLDLLAWLSEQGFTIEEMQRAHAVGQLTSLAADRELLQGDPLPIEQILEEAGLDAPMLEQLLRASGFVPSRARLSETSIDLFRQFETARQLFSDEELMHFVRVMGSSLGRIADAANSLFLIDVEAPMRTTDKPCELDLAKSQLFSIQLIAGLQQFIGNLFRLHMDDAIRRSRDARRGSGGLEATMMAVGFIDLVGYTTRTSDAGVRELLDLVLDFEGRAYDTVTDHGGRVVKLIGDEVMFTAPRPADAAAIAVALVNDFRSRGDIAPRGGLAYGDVLAHGGDCYGATVNLASRVADLAVPWEILVTEELASEIEAGYVLEPAGRRMLKGFAEPVRLHALVDAR